MDTPVFYDIFYIQNMILRKYCMMMSSSWNKHLEVVFLYDHSEMFLWSVLKLSCITNICDIPPLLDTGKAATDLAG